MQQVYQYLTGESVRNKTTDKHIAELISEGLAQPEQEPVAWMDREGDIYRIPEIKGWAPPHTFLYTAQIGEPK